LTYDGPKNRIVWGKCNCSLNLNLKSGGTSLRVMRINDYVVEWMAFGCSLHLDAVDLSSR